MSVTWRQVAAWRTRKHGLDVRRPAAEELTTLVDAVGKALGDRIEPLDVEGEAYRARVEEVADLRAAESVKTVRLLPAFDQYVIAATRHASHLLDGGTPDRVYRPQGWLSPVLMVNGLTAGVWSRERKGGKPTVTVEPFRSLSPVTRKGVVAEVDRMADSPEVHWAD